MNDVCDLSNKHCVPCEGGVDVIDRATAEKMLADVPGWTLSGDGKMINRRFTFSYAKSGDLLRQFLGFATASALGLVVNWAVSMLFRNRFPDLPLQIAAMVGIVAGMGFNYATSRYLVFRKARVKDV